MISIRRYLDGARNRSQGGPCGETCLPFCTGLLKALEGPSRAAEADPAAPPEQEPAADWGRLQSEWETADRSAESLVFLDRALQMSARENETRGAARRREAVDMQAILTMLNETLLAFASGSDRGIERLLRVQTELTKAAQLDDVLSMRAHLGETTRFIREEMTREREAAAQTTRKLQDKFGMARSTILRSLPGMPGKEEAIKAIEAARADAEAPKLAVVAASLERFRTFSERFGPAVWDDVFQAFFQSAPRDAWRNSVFRWAPATLVWMVAFPEDIGALRGVLGDQLRAPHEYQTLVNGRKVRLSLPIQWMCGALLEQPSAVLLQQVDRLSSMGSA